MTAPKWIAFLLTITACYFASSILIPVVLAFFLAILLDPVVQALQNRGIKRALSVPLIVGAALASTAVIGWLGYRATWALADEVPHYAQKVRAFLSHLGEQARLWRTASEALHVAPAADPMVTRVQVVDPFPTWTGFLLRGMGTVFGIVSLGLLVPLLVTYFLLEKSDLLESFNAIAGPYCYLPKLNQEFPRMIRALITSNLAALAVLCFLQATVFYAIGLEHALPLAMIASLFNLIPIAGPPLAMVFPLAQCLNQSDNWPLYLLVAGSIEALHFFVANVVIPRFVGSRINVSSSALIIGLLFWGWLWGAMGFLMAIPLTAAMKIVLESNRGTYFLSNLLAAKPRHVRPLVRRTGETSPRTG